MKSLVLIVMLAFSCAYAGFDFKEKDLANLYSLCNKGDGKYSACTKLTDILSKHCDSGNAEKCGELGYVLYEIGKTEESIAPLEKACDADLAFYCFKLGSDELGRTDNINRAHAGFSKACKLGIKDKKLLQVSCMAEDKLKECLSNSECNPLKVIESIYYTAKSIIQN